MEPQDRTYPLEITAEQSKLLQSALRIKILRVLEEEARTAKQVADYLQKTPGNVHYHIQKLLEGGLLHLVSTQTVGGVVEKYYRSVGSWFKSPDMPEHTYVSGRPELRMATFLSLSDTEMAELQNELDQLIARWEARQTSGSDYGILFSIGKVIQEDN
jgi:DNA-binding transcriptional ArsR family regulator